MLDLLFPPKCPACGRYTERRDTWCDSCFAGLVKPHRLPLDAEMYSLFDGGICRQGSGSCHWRQVMKGRKDCGAIRAERMVMLAGKMCWQCLCRCILTG